MGIGHARSLAIEDLSLKRALFRAFLCPAPYAPKAATVRATWVRAEQYLKV